MRSASPTVIRLTITNEVRDGLRLAKKKYPTLSDPEILKLGLAKIVTEHADMPAATEDLTEIRRGAASALGADYLSDSEEDIYAASRGKKVRFP